jgi:hypothetical protein
MTNEEIILTESQELEIDSISEMYNEALNEYKSAEAKKEAFNSMLKQTLKDYGLTKYTSKSGISISVTSKPNIKWDEDKLLKFCKESNIADLVKTKEYVDMDALESAIYNDKIKAEDLKPFQIVKPDIVTLRCTQKEIIKG